MSFNGPVLSLVEFIEHDRLCFSERILILISCKQDFLCRAQLISLIWLGKVQQKVVLLQPGFLFCLLQDLYTRLVASTHRWQVLQKHLKGLPVNKVLSDTGWSARHDAERSFNKSYHETIAALDQLATYENQTRDSRF